MHSASTTTSTACEGRILPVPLRSQPRIQDLSGDVHLSFVLLNHLSVPTGAGTQTGHPYGHQMCCAMWQSWSCCRRPTSPSFHPKATAPFHSSKVWVNRPSWRRTLRCPSKAAYNTHIHCHDAVVAVHSYNQSLCVGERSHSNSCKQAWSRLQAVCCRVPAGEGGNLGWFG